MHEYMYKYVVGVCVGVGVDMHFSPLSQKGSLKLELLAVVC